MQPPVAIADGETCLVQIPGGQVRWWTFAGGVANSLLANSLKPLCSVKSDNLSLSFANTTSLDSIAALIDGIQPSVVRPIPNPDAMQNLKFSECLSPEIAAEVFLSRFNDPAAVEQALQEPRRVIAVG